LASSPDPFDFSDYSRPETDSRTRREPDSADFTRFSGAFDQDPGNHRGFAPSELAPSEFAQSGLSPQYSSSGPGPFGSDVGPATVRAVTPPVVWLSAAGFVAVVGVVIALCSFASGTLAVVAWTLSGIVAIGVLAAFTVRDTRARASAFYSQPVWIPWVVRAVLVISCAGVLISAWNIADWIGRL
jgi:hypothetical protein